MNLRVLLPLLTVVIVALPKVKANVTIDSFEDRPTDFPITAVSNDGVLTFPQTFPHVIGGRDVNLNISGSLEGGSASVDINNSSGSFFHYSSTGSAVGNLSLEYGNSFDGSGGPMRLSINPATDILRLTFLEYNHSGGEDMELNATLETGLFPNNSSVTIFESLRVAGSLDVDIPLASLPDETLDKVVLEFNAPQGTDFELDSVAIVTTIPEPGLLGLLGLFAVVGQFENNSQKRSPA